MPADGRAHRQKAEADAAGGSTGRAWSRRTRHPDIPPSRCPDGVLPAVAPEPAPAPGPVSNSKPPPTFLRFLPMEQLMTGTSVPCASSKAIHCAPESGSVLRCHSGGMEQPSSCPGLPSSGAGGCSKTTACCPLQRRVWLRTRKKGSEACDDHTPFDGEFCILDFASGCCTTMREIGMFTPSCWQPAQKWAEKLLEQKTTYCPFAHDWPLSCPPQQQPSARKAWCSGETLTVLTDAVAACGGVPPPESGPASLSTRVGCSGTCLGSTTGAALGSCIEERTRWACAFSIRSVRGTASSSAELQQPHHRRHLSTQRQSTLPPPRTAWPHRA
mmetsp:Transcript_10605/g.33726  ORF Transcript_10605/g.33726 Transcript_10605/m.33726 type:complete len:329 (-) Transcript_10605:82-1068(-)